MTQSNDRELTDPQRPVVVESVAGPEVPSFEGGGTAEEAPTTGVESAGGDKAVNNIDSAAVPLPPGRASAFVAGAIAIVHAIGSEFEKTRRSRAKTERETLRLRQERIKADAEAVHLSAARAAAFRTRATTALLAFVVLAFAAAIVLEMMRDTIFVEPFSIPPDLAQKGYTPEVVADRIRDEMSARLEDVREERLAAKSEAKEDRPDIQIPVSGISVRAIGAYLREMFADPAPRLSGDLTLVSKPTLKSSVADNPEEGGDCIDSESDHLIQLVLRYTAADRITTSKFVCSESRLETALAIAGQEAAYLSSPLDYAYYFYRYNDYKRTIEAIKVVLKHPPKYDDAEAFNLKGLVLAAQDKPEAAIESFRQATEINPDWILPYLNWGNVEADVGNLEAATEKYRKWAEIRLRQAWTDDERQARADLAWQLYQVGRDEEANEIYKSAYGRDEPAKLGDAMVWMGRYQAAADAFADAFAHPKNDEDRTQALEKWGGALVELGRKKEAEQKFREIFAIERTADPAAAHLRLGRLLSEDLDDHEAALAEIRQAIPPEDNNAEARYREAEALYGLAQYREAGTAAERATTIGPGHAGAFEVWGKALLELGDEEEALRKLEKARKTVAYVRALVDLRRYEDAEQATAREVKERPYDYIARVNWGYALFLLDRHDEAVEQYRKAQKMNRRYTGLLRNWAHVLLSQEQFEAAAAKLDRAVAFDAGALLQRGRVNFHAGRQDTAMRDFEAASLRDPKNVYALIWLAVADPELSARDLKVRATQVDLDERPGPILSMIFGELSREELLARARDAVLWCARERECEAYFFIGEITKQRGDIVAAAEAFQRAKETDVRDFAEYDSLRLELRQMGRPKSAATR